MMLRKSIQALRALSTNSTKVLAIETSCDDTAVAIVSKEKNILASKKFTNRQIQTKLGGICPSVCAQQHREMLPKLLSECVEESGVHIRELAAVAVTVTPGLVIALKEGIHTAISLAKSMGVPLIPVHHMRAHALSILLSTDRVKFPYCTLLISGGHALICEVKSPDDFVLYGMSVSGSPGECIDKVARELDIENAHSHAGAAVEMLAKRASENGHLRYSSVLPSTSGADMNFSQLKSTYLNLAAKHKNSPDFCREDFCASLQHSVARHLTSKLHSFLDWYTENESNRSKTLVIGGGVAANAYIANGITKLADAYEMETFQVPLELCSDNAEMIGYTAILMLENKSPAVIHHDQIPDNIYAHARSDIGVDHRWKIPAKPRRRLAVSTIHGNQSIRFHKDYKRMENAESQTL
ncbi:unnamed protein product [Caenorhabditis bovis]|uniref:N(6)-L-threonylcarbamoyladenine synthase n=1 Tax=Caenorhabditis bovis TaxID=2654633 RepID=A0A8S1DZC9_9PELO|nr:unnamed protein product [Caenorhabditis bovis]